MWKFLGACFCVLLSLFFAADKTVLIENLNKPNTARIYIEGKRPQRNISVVSDALFNQSSWCKDCVNTKTIFSNDTGHLKAKITAKDSDTVTISLMGQHFMLDNKKMPLFNDYKNFTVNGERIFSKFKNADIKNYYKHIVNMQPGQTLEFSVDVQKSSIFASLKYIKINFYVFFISLLLSWFALCASCNFVRKYKGTERWDAILLLIFGFVLFIPMSYISSADKNEQENRILAQKPNLLLNDELNQKFGKEFDAWFNDRFNGRQLVINFYKKLQYKLSDQLIVNNLYINKDNKWIIKIPNNKEEFSSDELNVMSKNVTKLKQFANKHNMKLYIMIAPHKNLLYGNEVCSFCGGEKEHNQTIQAIKHIKSQTNTDIIYPIDELTELTKTDMVFFKTDHHWTDSGAFVAYKKLMESIKKDFPRINILTENDFDYFYSDKVRVNQDTGLFNGSEHKKAGLNDLSFFDTKYKYFKHKNDEKMTIKTLKKNSENYIIKNMSFDAKNKYNLTLFGNSFVENLEPIIPYSFKNTFKIYTWTSSPSLRSTHLNIQRFESDIIKNKTNALVVVFANIGNLMYIYKD